MQHIIETASLNKFFHDPADVQVLFDVNMTIQQGDFVSVVMLPALKLAKLPEAQIRENAMKHLQNLGIDKLADKEAFRISGGEKQRVAIARALINDPLIIMGDEPTGNLDKKNTEIVFETFQHISQSYNQALLIVTHDPGFASRTHRIIEMEDGRIVK